MSTLTQKLLEAKKALGALAVGAAGALSVGFIDQAEAGYVMGGVTVATSVIVWWLDNADKPVTVSDTGPGTTQPAAPPVATAPPEASVLPAPPA